MDCVQSNYLRKQPSHTDICAYTERIAAEAGDVEVPPQPAAGQHRTTRSTFQEPRPALSRAGFLLGTRGGQRELGTT